MFPSNYHSDFSQLPAGAEDILARAAFDRALGDVAGLEDEGLYFRPGGWSIDLPVTGARIVVAAAVLAAGFQVAGLEDLNREIGIAAAGLVASMDVRPVRLGRHERRLADRLHEAGLAELPLTAGRARELSRRGGVAKSTATRWPTPSTSWWR